MDIAVRNYPVAIRVATIIKQKGLKQCHIAERANMTAHDLNNMLNGRKLINPCDVLRLADALEITPSDLFDTGQPDQAS